MSEIAEQKVYAITQSLDGGVAPPPETVRSLLLWFGDSRRSVRVVRKIRTFLERHGLRTEPDFEGVWLDEEIRFAKSSAADEELIDPVVRIGRIDAANKPPVSVTPNASLAEVVTVMLTNDFSQVPVMTGPREVKGVVSWKTIGTRLALDRQCVHAKDVMEAAVTCLHDEPLFDAITKISQDDYVLVCGKDRAVTGIVTATDFNFQFQGLAEPFLLSGEIEVGLRRLLHQKFSKEELVASANTEDRRDIESVSDLTLGEYIRLMENPINWDKIGLKIDRAEFITRLHRIRQIRNDVMHFDPDGLDSDDLVALREFARFMKRLREVGCA